ncbi:mechanosensitive ion channel family protein [Agromyces sp. NPDC056379]|uniref:mechanosensitive ion channel family protein n=1 Tax=unclassified Agromyces TaxID=2639701 RepID=UPI0035DE58CC
MDDAWMVFWVELAVALLIAVAVFATVEVGLRLAGRHSPFATALLTRIRWPLAISAPLAAAAIAVTYLPDPDWAEPLSHTFAVLLIVSGAWLIAGAFLVVADHALSRSSLAASDSQEGRRLRTQVQVLRRLVVALIAIVALGAIFLSFESVRAVGASLLASAGIVSVVVGLAAQSLLGNLFAGVQLAFSEAIRVGDVVVIEEQWGRVHEITLSYVVVITWDRRVLVLPCTRFTTGSFENWTKLQSELSGTVEILLDWQASIPALREQLDLILAATDLWDADVARVQVTDIAADSVRVRVLISAADAPTLWQLRCHVREELAGWVRTDHPDWIPRQRVRIDRSPDTDPRDEAS